MNVSSQRFRQFRNRVWRYYRRHGRNFPWRNTSDPYKILISEVMLQQTQVGRVVPKYKEFIKRFPNFQALARAPLGQVLETWHGLGYNRRAVALKKLSAQVTREYHGVLPKSRELLVALPAVGHGTAGALLAFAFHTPWPFIETNIRRAFIQFFFPKKKKVKDSEILPLVVKTLDRRRPREWYWALMDYGAMLGQGKNNPNRRSAEQRKQSTFRGSHRELRGKIIAVLLKKKQMSPEHLAKELTMPPARIRKAVGELEKEGFIVKSKNMITMAETEFSNASRKIRSSL